LVRLRSSIEIAYQVGNVKAVEVAGSINIARCKPDVPQGAFTIVQRRMAALEIINRISDVQIIHSIIGIKIAGTIMAICLKGHLKVY
jgi:hypothetical protein